MTVAERPPRLDDLILPPPERVLSTLEADGSRRWLSPRLSRGKWWRRRRWVAYGLIAFFVTLPHLRIQGKPPVLLDIVHREFTFVGHTFLPTDTLLLALVMLMVFVTVVGATAVAGRVWCGWGCPQTVYMEFLFRPIDRLFGGTMGKGGKAKPQASSWLATMRIGVYVVLCMGLAHTFLSYFVGTDNLRLWLTTPPTEHPVAFLVMLATTAAMLFDFLYFREQMCLIACPYGRFQSVMLDRGSLIVAYDETRGEPRKLGKHQSGDGAGDCIDCHRCVAVCPTGIDIRDGLQMECINCTQCIDACDDVMDRTHQPRGLIRYSSQDSLAGKATRLWRFRTVAYPIILLVLGTAFVAVLSTKYAFDARLIRQQGNPFYRTEDGAIANRFHLRLTNRSDANRRYEVSILTPEQASVSIESPPNLNVGQSRRSSLAIAAPASQFSSGRVEVQVLVSDDLQNERIISATLIGPSS